MPSSVPPQPEGKPGGRPAAGPGGRAARQHAGASVWRAADLAERAGRELAEGGHAALLVLADSARDPDLALFAGSVHVGSSLVVLPRGGEPALGFFSPMDREEAAATGLALLTPEELDVPRRVREGLTPERVLAAAAARALALAGVAPGRIAVAGSGPAGTVHAALAALAAEGWTPVPGNALARLLRKRKSAAQLAEVRRAAAGLCRAMHRVAAVLAAAAPGGGAAERGRRRAEQGAAGGGEAARGLTGGAAAGRGGTGGDRSARELWLGGERLTAGRLRAEIARSLAEDGLEQPAGNIVSAGREAGVPHTAGRDDRVLAAGEPVLVDLYPRGALFADGTRTFCVGPPPAPLAAAHAAVRDALAAAREEARPGVRGWTLHESACRRLGEAGWPTQVSHPDSTRGYVHGLGHGVGFELHEDPSFRKHAGAEGVLGEGDVFTLEPGLYDPDAGWGVRLEDTCHLGPDGLEVLTSLPYDLDPWTWGG